MHVKICGLTRTEDAQLARKLGAWALGFIFYPPSKRFISTDKAAEIIKQLPKPAPTVGVFVNQTDAAIAAAKEIKLSGLQLHGDETPEDCRRAKQETGCFIIKALRLKSENDLLQIKNFIDAADYILLDASHGTDYGGTGALADWQLAAQAVQENNRVPFILAGGIQAGNIVAGLRTVKPYALDLSSGVESAPGIKDAEKLTALFGIAKGEDDE